MNSFTKQTWTYRKQIYGYQRGKSGEEINQELRKDTHYYIEDIYILNNDQLYRPGNSTQYSVITYKRRIFLKNEYIMCMIDSFCCIPEIQHYK